METLLAILGVLQCVLLVVLLYKSNHSQSSQAFEVLGRTIREESAQLKRDQAENARLDREEMQKSISNFAELLSRNIQESSRNQTQINETFLNTLKQSLAENSKTIEKLTDTLSQNLSKIREDNDQKLDKIRLTVEEKLQSTLEKRLGESFKLVSERLESVQKGLGEMQTLASGVGDLKKVLTNVKTRGIWGEVLLGNLLEQLLTPDQFEANVATSKTSERVEFAIKLPGRGENSKPVWIPIDSKFPKEDYERLLAAQETGDAALAQEAGKGLERSIRLFADDISKKYIAPPHTTDFGIMFLPSEGLFAEVIRRTATMDYLQNECRVMVTGPTTLAALLNSLQMGFKTLAIQQRSSEVWETLGLVKSEFEKYAALLERVKKKLNEATNTVDEAEVRTRAIHKKLRGVETLGNKEQNLELEDVFESPSQEKSEV